MPTPPEEPDEPPGVELRDVVPSGRTPGTSPGIERNPGVAIPPAPGHVRIRCIDYGPELVGARDCEDVDALLAHPRPVGARVRWINVDGLNAYVVNRLRLACGFHTLAAEDVLSVPQRLRVDTYDGHLYLVARMLRLERGRLVSEQISLFFFRDLLITFQETPGDVWDPIRERIERPGSRLRAGASCYLLYALLDSLVDHLFPILEHYGEEIEELEEAIVASPGSDILQRVHTIKRELVVLRKVVWPMRALVDGLQSEDHADIAPSTRTYLRDVHDHALHVLEVVESYREMSAGLTEMYMSAVSQRTNDVMKVLTILASLFIPITFLAGVYGMNFEHIPELGWRFSYLAFWALCLTSTALLLVYFRRKGWLG